MNEIKEKDCKCRCCGALFHKAPVLSYENMPAKAQDLPKKEELGADCGIDLEVFQCPYCGLIQLSGEPVAYYRDVLRAVGISEEMKVFRRAYFREFLSRFHLETGRILEIGAGKGEYMELFQELGADVYGLEHRAESVKAGREKGLKLYRGFIEKESTVLPEAPYDAFYIMSFLEHIPNPNGFLRGIRNGLKAGGVGIVEVPNGNFILEKHLFSEFMLDHLMYFTEDSLRLILEKNGFQVLSIKPIWKDYILSAIVRRREEEAAWESFLSQQKKLITEILQFADAVKKEGGRLAVWGAGHQAFALLSLAGLEKWTEFVVDSAVFKQNRYTPATHIPIVSPEEIGKQKIDAVLVMAGSYNTEVIGILKTSWPHVRIAAVEAEGVREIISEPLGISEDAFSGWGGRTANL